MKKYFVIVMAFILLATSICGCDGTADDNSAAESIADYGIGDVVAGAELDRTAVYSTFSEEQRAALVAAGEKQGITVTFGDDGSTVFAYNDGSKVITQHSDGTVSYRDGDADESATAQLNDSWPQNQYTAKLPVPELKVGSSSEINGKFTVIFDDADKAGASAYVQSLKDAGFTAEAEEKDTPAVYSYEATDAQGNGVKLIFVGGSCTVSITLAD